MTLADQWVGSALSADWVAPLALAPMLRRQGATGKLIEVTLIYVTQVSRQYAVR
jgi:hypothetical protein